MCVSELFGGSVDWFSSSKSSPATTSANAVGSSAWTNSDAAFSTVTNGHIDVWPSLTSSGTLPYITVTTVLWPLSCYLNAFSALMLLVGWQEGHHTHTHPFNGPLSGTAAQPTASTHWRHILPVKTEWWGDGMVICLEQGADLHMAQLIPLPLTVSCFSKIQIGFTFLVLVHPGSPGLRAINGCGVFNVYGH